MIFKISKSLNEVLFAISIILFLVPIIITSSLILAIIIILEIVEDLYQEAKKEIIKIFKEN